MARLKDTIIEGNARVTGSLYLNNELGIGDINLKEVDDSLNIDSSINQYFVTKNFEGEAQTNAYSVTVIGLCKLDPQDGHGTAKQFSCGEIYFKRNNGTNGSIHIHVEFVDRYTTANSCWFLTYGTAPLNPDIKNNYPTLGITGSSYGYYPCTFQKDGDWYGGIVANIQKNNCQKVYFYGFSGFEPFAIDICRYSSGNPIPDGTWYNPSTGDYDGTVCPYDFNFDNAYLNNYHTLDMQYVDAKINAVSMQSRLTLENGGPINQILTGSGLVGRNTGVSGAADRYQPARWIFNSGNAPQDGDIVTIEVPVAGHDYGTYLSIDNGTTYHPIVTSGTGRLTTHFVVGEYITLVFRADGSAASMFYAEGQADTTRHTITGGVWAVINFYNTNTNTLLRTYRQDGTDANHEYPVVAVSSTTTKPAAFTLPGNDSYKDCYGIISQRTPTINPSTGFITIHGLKGSENVDYGEVLPENPTEGQIFFQLSEPYYELPIGGSTGQCLVKRSNTDRDVMWGTSVPNGGTTGQALIKASDADGDVSWGTVNVDDKVSKSGDTMTGQLCNADTGGRWIDGRDKAFIRHTTATSSSTFSPIFSAKTMAGSWEAGPCHPNNDFFFSYSLDSKYNSNTNETAQIRFGPDGKVYGAVWNDYAEMRRIIEDIKPGSCVYEIGDDTMAPTYQRLQKGCKIVSDTFGFNIGETDTAKTPIAVSGRALVYLFEGREAACNAIGEFVCSGPNGTVSIMTTEEYLQNPQAVVGTISAVPDYEEWGSTNVKVNGRIWIYVR